MKCKLCGVELDDNNTTEDLFFLEVMDWFVDANAYCDECLRDMEAVMRNSIKEEAR